MDHDRLYWVFGRNVPGWAEGPMTDQAKAESRALDYVDGYVLGVDVIFAAYPTHGVDLNGEQTTEATDG